MWQKLADFAKTLLSYGEMLQQNRADIRELQQEVRTLSTALQLLTREVQHSRETQRHEAELLKLQVG